MGRALGYREAFARQHPHDVFREHAALSGFENDGQRAFDIGALADLSREAWDAMPPVRWPVSRSEAAGISRAAGMAMAGCGWCR